MIWSQMKSGKKTGKNQKGWPKEGSKDADVCLRRMPMKKKLAWKSVEKLGKKMTAEAKGKQK